MEAKKKVLVQNTTTGCYLDPDDRWVASGMHAKLFHTSSDALMHCDHRQIADAHIVLRFLDDSSLDIVLPVATSSPRPDAVRMA